jgi:hypothetical protein
VKIIFDSKSEEYLESEEGTAAKLIHSENSVAQEYLRSLLGGLKLKEKVTSLSENCLCKNGVLDIPVLQENFFGAEFKIDESRGKCGRF